MDLQGRLTEWDEWCVAEMYRWKKSYHRGSPMRCAEVNRREGFVRFEREGCEEIITFYNWKRRFEPVLQNVSDGRTPGGSE